MSKTEYYGAVTKNGPVHALYRSTLTLQQNVFWAQCHTVPGRLLRDFVNVKETPHGTPCRRCTEETNGM